MLVFKASALLRLPPIPIVLTIYCIFVQNRPHGNTISSRISLWASTKVGIGASNLTATKSTFSHGVEGFWNNLALALEDARPHSTPIEVEDGHPTSRETTFGPLNVLKASPSRLINFTDDQETDLIRSHYLMRTSAQRLAPRLAFSRCEKGIVTTANAKYMPILLVSLRMLRRTGCQLPVEVFIDNWTK